MKSDLKLLEDYVRNLLNTRLPDGLFYHGTGHTFRVYESASLYAGLEGLTSKERSLLKVAALFHDTGFIKQYSHNEEIGVQIARKALPDFGYSNEELNEIEHVILGT